MTIKRRWRRPATRRSPPRQTTRCAIYTRKSTEEGLQQDFNTLDAQRENNRLTGETNRLLKDMNRTIGNLGGGGQAAFG